MFNIGGLEFLIILVVALIFLGPERLPGAARQAGKTLSALREMAQSFQDEFQEAMNDPIEADARTKGTAAVAAGAPTTTPEPAADSPDDTAAESTGDAAVESAGDTATGDTAEEAADTSSTTGAAGAAATAAHIATSEPDRSYKPQSASVNGTAESEDVVPDPADLNFASAAPRYPRAEVSEPELDVPDVDDSDVDGTDIDTPNVDAPDAAPEAGAVGVVDEVLGD